MVATSRIARRRTIRFLHEENPGAVWQELAEQFWPAYRRWFLKEGAAARPTYLASRRELDRHMPEISELHEELADLAGGGDLVARCLGLYCPTPYAMACSQLALSGARGALVRNYDYSPDLWEEVVLTTGWNGRKVMGMSDCLWGLLDGINEDGLAVSLAFGGRRVLGPGFGMPLILRYILQIASTTAEAVRILTRVPCHMAYNVTVLDDKGDLSTVQVSPDRAANVLRDPIATNHQGEIEWREHAEATFSIEREKHLRRLLEDGKATPESLEREFLLPPLYSLEYARARGTLYTCAYRPAERAAAYIWPDQRIRRSIDDTDALEIECTLGGGER